LTCSSTGGTTLRERYWSDRYIQHSAHIELGHDGLFNQIRSLPDTLRYENRLILAEGEYVITHARFSGSGREAAWIAVVIVRFERRQARRALGCASGRSDESAVEERTPMFGDPFLD
jgi:predicted SnoaL-like aldol condensation-catalyzing enzyme